MAIRSYRRTVTTSLVAIAAVGGMVLAAPNSAAATTTSCTSGFSPWTLASVNFFVPSSSCPSFADNGSLYVFDINTLNVAQQPPFDPRKPPYTQHANAVATCTSYTRGSNVLTGTNCTIRF